MKYIKLLKLIKLELKLNQVPMPKCSFQVDYILLEIKDEDKRCIKLIEGISDKIILKGVVKHGYNIKVTLKKEIY